MRMGAQTEKIKEGGLGCANRVRKGFLGGGQVRKGAQRCARVHISAPTFIISSK